ncbi:MAG: lipid-A-disaccharide synthase [Rhizobiaceae bacterium]|nr:lipid-A-disaccharide synthase [Rhizobiaceae bacterium]
MSRALKVAVIAGEESGDLLAADLVQALKIQSGREVDVIGVGGRHLAELGMKSIFPANDIALMGLSAVVRDLPRLVSRIGLAARTISEQKPDCLVTVDSPEFNLRVAAKVRAANPSIPIVHYVCPSVWAWRPGRAAAMRPNVDRVLCILPFEASELERLGGPAGTYVGHRLAHDPDVLRAAAAQAAKHSISSVAPKTLLLLPGSRKGEVRALMDPFLETVEVLRSRGRKLNLLLPTVPNTEDLVSSHIEKWPQQPQILKGAEAKWNAFAQADAALIASGTVSLELALCGVPTVSTYKLDPFARMLRGLVTAWSACLPNLIADRTIVPECIEDLLRPKYMARYLEALLDETAFRQWQIDGFSEVGKRMRTSRPSGEIAADAVLSVIAEKK